METLVCSGVSKRYGEKEAVKNVELTLEKGKIYGMIGRNGAGKTTLLSLMSAQNPVSDGAVTWNGQEIWENQEALHHICFSREILPSANGNGISGMKVKEYLRTASWYYQNWDQDMADKLIQKFELNVKQKMIKLSKGMLSMVTIVVALASKADFTFLDEPVAGLDVVMREYFYRILLDEYAKSGRTFVISTHIIEEAADIFEEVIMLKDGTILLKENTMDLLEHAYRISGRSEDVDWITEGLKQYDTKGSGRGKSVTVFLKEGEKLQQECDVSIQPLNLQNIFVALCGMEE